MSDKGGGEDDDTTGRKLKDEAKVPEYEMPSTFVVKRSKRTYCTTSEEPVERVVMRFGTSSAHVHVKHGIAAVWKVSSELVVRIDDLVENVGQKGMNFWEVGQEQAYKAVNQSIC